MQDKWIELACDRKLLPHLCTEIVQDMASRNCLQ